MEKTKKNFNKNQKAVATSRQIVKLPIESIILNWWEKKGIRDPENFENLKMDLLVHGQNTPILVKPAENKKYMEYKGKHCYLAAKEIGWTEVDAIINTTITDEEAMEVSLADNLTHSDYSSIDREEQINNLWNTGRYKTHEELAKKIGKKKGAIVGQNLNAYRIRQMAKVILSNISTKSISDTSSLESDEDRIALLTLKQEGKINGNIKGIAQRLSTASDDLRKAVLYEGVPYDDIKAQINRQFQQAKPKKKKTTTIGEYEDIAKQLYDFVKEVPDNISLMDDGQKNKSLDYCKFSLGILAETLKKNENLSDEQFTQIIQMMDIDKSILYNYTGFFTKGVNSSF